MIDRKFKVGDRVRFTQEAKDRFEDSEYWYHGNFPELDLNKTYTVRSNHTNSWPACQLHDCNVPYIATYLLEPAETQKNKNMQKKDFILALVQALFPNHELKYRTQKNCTTVTVLDYPNPHGVAENIPLTVRCSKVENDSSYNFVLAVPSSHRAIREWEDSDVEKVTKFLEKQCNLDCGKNNIWIKNENSLVMFFGDYPWRLVDEIKPLEQSPTKGQQIQALQAEIQQLKAENERLKAQTYTIEIPQGVTSICLNLKG